MIRALLTFILLFSFALNAVADDSCCFKPESSCASSHAQVNADHPQQADPMDHPEVCINCVRCGIGLNLPLFTTLPIFTPKSAHAIGYVPLIAPTPDLLGFLRPPIA